MPINNIKGMTGASEDHKVNYNPRNVPKPNKELQRLIFPFIERCNISLNALYAPDTRTASCAFLDFMERFRTLLLQYVAQ